MNEIEGGTVHIMSYQMPYQTNIYDRLYSVWYAVIDDERIKHVRKTSGAIFNNNDDAAAYAYALKERYKAVTINSFKATFKPEKNNF